MFGFTEDPTDVVDHRLWPLPRRPWIMAQRWNNLLFAHWPADNGTIQAQLPRSLPLDMYQGMAWISITPLCLTHLRLRGTPALPWVSVFPELNVRTYVLRDGKPGIYFFRMDVGRKLAALGGRVLYHLPYVSAEMHIAVGPDGAVHYRSRGPSQAHGPAVFNARYRATGPVSQSHRGSLDHWLTERYCLYSVDRQGQLYQADIHHRPWPLQQADAILYDNNMADACRIPVSGMPRLSFARRLDVVVWSPERCAT